MAQKEEKRLQLIPRHVRYALGEMMIAEHAPDTQVLLLP